MNKNGNYTLVTNCHGLPRKEYVRFNLTEVFLRTDSESAESNSLDIVLLQGDRFQTHEAVHLFTQICQELSKLFDQGQVHGDLKPSTILLKNDSSAGDAIEVIIDCKAGAWAGLRPGFSKTKTPCTGENSQYASPERCLGLRPDERSDIYSMECIMYRVLTGSLPFNGSSEFDIIRCHLKQAPPRFFGRQLAIVSDIELIVLKCLNKDPEARFSSFAQLKQALERLNLVHSPGAGRINPPTLITR